LERARKELAALVKSRQDLAEKTREEARRDIGLGMGEIESGVSGDITQALADAKRREEMITGGYVSPEERGEEFSAYDQLPELFRGEYTDEEKQLAERLGLRSLDEETGEYTDQASMAQDQLQRLLDPYNKEYGFLNPEEFQGDEVKGVDYRNLDPLSSLFTTINPETVYTPEQMIGEQESSRLAELQQLIGPEGSAPITRAEGALGGAGRTIESGNVQDWLDQMAGFQEEKQQRAEDIRKSRMVEEFEVKIPEPQETGNFQVDEENYLDYMNRLEKTATDAEKTQGMIEAYDAWEAARDKVAESAKAGPFALDEARAWAKKNPAPPEPGILDRVTALFEGGHAVAKLKQAQTKRALAQKEYIESLNIPKPTTSGPSSGPGGGGWSQQNAPSGPAAPTQADTGQYYA